jgi:hypothetical protein
MLNWLKNLLPAKPQPLAEASSTSVSQLPDPPAPIALIPELAAVPQSATSTAARWISPGEIMTIADYTFTHGMVYVGDSLTGISQHVSIEPCLINPQLKVDPEQPDRAGDWMTLWPSYSEIPSGCRAAYLEWLAAGRTDPEIHIGYVFLFLYGLERRVLHDFRGSIEDFTAGLTQIMTEVERLMALYDHSDSFVRDAANFLDACWLLQSPQGLALKQPSGASIPLQLTLGKLAQAGHPLPAHWALAWVLNTIKVSPSPCLSELQSLFHLQYHSQFGDGVVLDGSGPTVCLTRTYQPATVSFGGPIDITAVLPETRETKNLETIRPVVEACIAALDPYCRWLSRNVELQGSYAAILRLPAEIAQRHEQPEVTQFRRWATGCLSEHEFQVIPAGELLQQWTTDPVKTMAKADAVILAQFLETQNVGIEPDVRFGGKPLKATQNVVLFRLIHGVMAEPPSSNYVTAQLLLHLAATIVASEAQDAAGVAHVQKYLAWTPTLQEPERDRLLAHFQWLCHSKPTLRGLKSRLADLSESRKVAIAQFLISTAKARGEAQADAIDKLTKLYPLLGFEAEQVDRQLHSFTPLTPATAKAPPMATAATTTTIDLNLDLIQRRQDESQAVSAMLSDIFVEESAAPEPLKVSTDIGLDKAHANFLLTLATQPQWDRRELEKIASNLNLMLDGALENINEVAFDQCDEALIEGDEPLEINPVVLKQLLAD